MKQLIEKFGASYAGGRLVAKIEGKKQYLTNVSADGRQYLNELGVRLQSELEAAPEVEAPKAEPKAKKAKKEVVAATKVSDEIEIDI